MFMILFDVFIQPVSGSLHPSEIKFLGTFPGINKDALAAQFKHLHLPKTRKLVLVDSGM